MEDETPETDQTPGSFERFKEFTRRVVGVPKAEVARREKEYRRKRESPVGSKPVAG